MRPNLDPLNHQGEKISDYHVQITMLWCRSIDKDGYVVKSK